MKDLRLYNRLNVDVLCTLYVGDSIEVIVKIKNISESGVYLELDYRDDISEFINNNMIVKIQGIDDFTYFDKPLIAIFNENLNVLRIERKGDKLGLACKVSERVESYYKYVTNMKVSNFVKSLEDEE